jgi:hypothetical protein
MNERKEDEENQPSHLFNYHIPVLLKEAIQGLAIKPSGRRTYKSDFKGIKWERQISGF